MTTPVFIILLKTCIVESSRRAKERDRPEKIYGKIFFSEPNPLSGETIS